MKGFVCPMKGLVYDKTFAFSLIGLSLDGKKKKYLINNTTFIDLLKFCL